MENIEKKRKKTGSSAYSLVRPFILYAIDPLKNATECNYSEIHLLSFSAARVNIRLPLSVDQSEGNRERGVRKCGKKPYQSFRAEFTMSLLI